MDFLGSESTRVRIGCGTNTPIYLRNTICSEFKVKQIGDLGTYLGVLLIYGKLQKKYFHYLTKGPRRIIQWKIRFPSKAARTVFLNSCLNYLPFYSIQTTTVPRGVLLYFEKFSRQFF